MKKSLALILTLIMSLSVLSGCGAKETENKSQTDKVKKGEYKLSVGTVTTDKDPLFAQV